MVAAYQRSCGNKACGEAAFTLPGGQDILCDEMVPTPVTCANATTPATPCKPGESLTLQKNGTEQLLA